MLLRTAARTAALALSLLVPAMLAKPAVKVLLNLALIGLDGLVRGGQLIIAAEEQDGTCEIAVNATGPKVVIDESLAAALQGDIGGGLRIGGKVRLHGCAFALGQLSIAISHQLVAGDLAHTIVPTARAPRFFSMIS